MLSVERLLLDNYAIVGNVFNSPNRMDNYKAY